MIRLGPFDLVAPVASGGMADVWQGLHRGQRVPVAVKVVHAVRAREPRYVSFFRGEVRTVAGLDHPNVVLVFDHGEIPSEVTRASAGRLVEGSPYLVMEWASGGTLSRWRPPSWRELSDALLALLDALAHAHARGVVHRDLKPGNVLVCTDEDVRPGLKLADFGIARPREGGANLAGTGTPSFMAPEQATGDFRDQGPWTDLYSLGCVAYRLATGEAPYTHRDPHRVLLAHLKRPVPELHPRIAVPDGFEPWVHGLLAKDPARRFRRAADAAWELVRLGEPTVLPEEAVEPDATPEPPTLGWLRRVDATPTVVDPEPIGRPLRSSTAPAKVPARPPMPCDWRKPEPPLVPRLLGVGLGLYGLRTVPLQDRGDERDRLWRALRYCAQTGRGAAVLLHGPAGSGKSRLADWLCQRAHEVGAATVMRATHGPLPGPTDGLGPMVARHLQCAGLGHAETVARMVRDLGAGAEGLDAWVGLAGLVTKGPKARAFRKPTERYALFRHLIQRRCAERPVVIWIEDAQWAADALGFAEYLARLDEHVPLPVLVLMTARDEALAQRALESDLIERLCEAGALSRIAVGPLSPADGRALVSRLLGLDEDLAVRVAERTAGNPLFAVALVGDWVQRGLLEAGPQGFRLRPGARPHLPADLEATWRERIERLLEGRPDDDGVALELAAVLGPEVHEDEWRTACAAQGVRVPEDLLESLLLERLARTVPGEPRWAFAHGMLCETLEARAAAAGRLRLHHRTCASMLAVDGGRMAAERRGLHLLAAEDWVDALDPLQRGAEERADAGDSAGARALLAERERAAQTSGLPPMDVRWAEGWVASAELARRTGRVEDAERWGERAERAARRWGFPEILAAALMSRGMVLNQCGDGDGARAVLVEGERVARSTSDPRLRARCRQGLAEVAWPRGEIDVAERWYRAALADYRAAGDEPGVAGCLHGLGTVARSRGDLDEAVRLLEQSRAAYDRTGDRWGAASALTTLSDVLRLSSRLDLAESVTRESIALFASVASPHRAYAELNLGMVLVDSGRHAEGRSVVEESRATFQAHGMETMLGVADAALLPCLAGTGDFAAFDEALGRAEAELALSGIIDADIARSFELAGDLARAAGEHARARAALEAALAHWEALDRPVEAGAVREKLARS